MQMQFFLRPYPSEHPIVGGAIRRGARLAGLVVDAHMAKYGAASLGDLRKALPSHYEALVDPVTHKIRSEFFRKKGSYQSLPYYLAEQVGTRPPKLRELREHSDLIVSSVGAVQSDFSVTSLVTPALYTTPDAFPVGSATTAHTLTRDWSTRFVERHGREAILSVCIAANCLADVDAKRGLDEWLRTRRPKSIYLQLFDYDLGVNPVLDLGVTTFLRSLQTLGVERVIMSHGPAWVYFLAPFGVTAFVSGANYLASLKEEYLARDEEIGGITHNYYIARRFCRMTPEQATAAIDAGLIEACKCPACHGTVPAAQNDIREHYIHARVAECAALQKASNAVELLHTWAEEAEAFLSRADAEEIKVTGGPTPTLWRGVLP